MEVTVPGAIGSPFDWDVVSGEDEFMAAFTMGTITTAEKDEDSNRSKIMIEDGFLIRMLLCKFCFIYSVTLHHCIA